MDIIVFAVITSVKIIISLFRSAPWIIWDELAYIDTAEQIFEGNLVIFGETSYTHPYPAGYAYLMAPAFILGDIGTVYTGMLVINALVSSAIIFPAFWITRQFLEPKTAVLVATTIAILPALTLHTFAVMSENVFVPLFMLSAFLLMKCFVTEFQGHKKIITSKHKTNPRYKFQKL